MVRSAPVAGLDPPRAQVVRGAARQIEGLEVGEDHVLVLTLGLLARRRVVLAHEEEADVVALGPVGSLLQELRQRLSLGVLSPGGNPSGHRLP